MIITIKSQDYVIALQVDSFKRLRHIYFGQQLKQEEEYPLIAQQLRYDEPDQSVWNHAYTPSGTWNIVEPALQILHADGNASTELDYIGHATQKVKDNIVQTTIDLKDSLYQTEVRLIFHVYQKENVFEQWVRIKNGEDGTIVLKKYAAANLYFRNKAFYLTHYHSTWATEMQSETQLLTAGIKVLDTKLGCKGKHQI